MFTTITGSGLPMLTQGSLKAFMRQGHYQEVKPHDSFSNEIPNLITPEIISSGATVSSATIYKLNSKFQYAKDYTEFISNRVLFESLDTAIFDKNTYYNYDTFSLTGSISTTDDMTTGIYEIVVELSNGVIFESEVFCVNADNIAPAIVPYLLVDDNYFLSYDGTNAIVWT